MRDLLATCEPRSRSSSPWSQSLCSRSAANSLASTLAFSWESALVRACQSPQDQRWPCRRRWDARLIVLALLAAPQCFPQCLEFSLHCRKRSLSQTKGLAEIRRLGCERVDDLHRSRGFRCSLASERRNLRGSAFSRVRLSSASMDLAQYYATPVMTRSLIVISALSYVLAWGAPCTRRTCTTACATTRARARVRSGHPWRGVRS